MEAESSQTLSFAMEICTKKNIIFKSKKTQFCQRSKKCIESLYFGDEQEGLPGGFPTGKMMLQSTQGAAACPACSAGASCGEMVPPSHCFSPLPGTALIVFKS